MNLKNVLLLTTVVLNLGLTQEDGLAQTAVADCATCHPSIVEEWESSFHAQAYTSPLFVADKEAREGPEQPSCSCHAPAQLVSEFLGQQPPARDDRKHLGVDCVSCHLDEEHIIWSGGETMLVPHWTKSNPIYGRGEFCAGCHHWADDKDSDCSGCHMPVVRGAPADGPHLEPAPQKQHRSHRWTASRDPETVASAVILKVAESSELPAVELTNLVPAHPFPVFDRRKAILALVETESGKVLWETSVRVEPDSSATVAIERPPEVPGKQMVQLRYYLDRGFWPDRYHMLTEVELK